MKPKKVNKNGTPPVNNSIKYTLWLAILLMGVTIGLFLNPTKTETPQPAQTQVPVFNTITMDIAGKFDCSCGSCNDILAECSCPTAVATKRFIKMNREQGATETEILDLVKAAYGYYRG